MSLDLTNLEDYNVPRLNEICRNNDITGYSYLNKDEKIGFIRHNLAKKPTYYGTLRISKIKYCNTLLTQYIKQKARYDEVYADGPYYESQKAIYANFCYDNNKLKLLDKKFISNEENYKDYIVVYTLRKRVYGNNKIRFEPTDIYDASRSILLMQRTIKNWLINHRNDIYIDTLNYIISNRKIVDIVRIQSFWRSYIVRAKHVDSLRYIEFIKNGYHIYPIDKDLKFESTVIGNNRNLYYYELIIQLKPYKRKYNIKYSLSSSINGNYNNDYFTKMTNLKLTVDKNYSFKFNLNNSDCKVKIVPNSLYLELKRKYKDYGYFEDNTYSFKYSGIRDYLIDYIQCNYIKNIFPFNKVEFNKEYICNSNLLKDICTKNECLIKILNTTKNSIDNNSLSVNEFYNSKLRLAYTYLYFLKGAFQTSLISYDLLLVVLNNVKNNPRFWSKGLQNKWLFEVKIEFSDELFKDLSDKNILQIIRNSIQ